MGFCRKIRSCRHMVFSFFFILHFRSILFTSGISTKYKIEKQDIIGWWDEKEHKCYEARAADREGLGSWQERHIFVMSNQTLILSPRKTSTTTMAFGRGNQLGTSRAAFSYAIHRVV